MFKKLYYLCSMLKNMALLLLLFGPTLTALILIIFRLIGWIEIGWGGNKTGEIGIILLLLALYTFIFFIVVIVGLPNPQYKDFKLGIAYLGRAVWPVWVAIVVGGLILLIIGKCNI